MGYPVAKLNENQLRIRVTELTKRVRRVQNILSRISEIGSRVKAYYRDKELLKAQASLEELINLALNDRGEE